MQKCANITSNKTKIVLWHLRLTCLVLLKHLNTMNRHIVMLSQNWLVVNKSWIMSFDIIGSFA